MIEAVLVLALLLTLAGVLYGAWLLVSAERPAPQVVVQQVLAAPAASAEKAAPLPKPITVQLVDGNGRELGSMQMLPAHRRPVLRCKAPKDGRMSDFVAERTLPNGQWQYRRVNVDRED